MEIDEREKKREREREGESSEQKIRMGEESKDLFIIEKKRMRGKRVK